MRYALALSLPNVRNRDSVFGNERCDSGKPWQGKGESSSRSEEFLQKARAFAGQNTAANLDLMIQGRVV